MPLLRVLGAVLLSSVVAGCAQKLSAPTAAPTGDQAPVALRNLQVASVDGYRAVLLRLSRLPLAVRQSSARNPGRIVVRAWGPLGDGDLAERALPQVDPMLSDVRVSRHQGALEVVLEFKSEEPPPFSVHEMADWVMIRLGVPEQG